MLRVSEKAEEVKYFILKKLLKTGQWGTPAFDI